MHIDQAPAASIHIVASQAQVGDLVFIRIPFKPFREVADTTLSWSNHVGVIVSTEGPDPQVAESTFPLSRITPLSRFVARSDGGRLAVLRWREPLSAQQRMQVPAAAHKRMGVFYDTGFDLHSSRQFCAKFVREVMQEATGRTLGEVESFKTLLARNPNANVTFWRVWYFGRIPWQRETISPASILRSPLLYPVFDGMAVASPVQPVDIDE